MKYFVTTNGKTARVDIAAADKLIIRESGRSYLQAIRRLSVGSVMTLHWSNGSAEVRLAN